MSWTSRGLAIGALFLCAIAFGNAAADAPVASPSVAASASAVTTIADAHTVAIGHVARIEQATRSVRKRGDLARRLEKVDAMQTTCLDDKLRALQALVGRASARIKQWESSFARGATEESNRHVAALAVLRRRAEQLESESNQCVAVDSSRVPDGTTVNTTIDPNIVNLDAPPTTASTATPTMPVGSVTIAPLVASPTK